MTFTDEDMKRLKEMIEAYDPHLKLPALLARLEAAESVCQSVIDNGDEPNFKFSMKAWRKAAGK